jgi:phosphoribosylamine--glycine ligase
MRAFGRIRLSDGLESGRSLPARRFIAETRAEAESAVVAAMTDRRFGDAGDRLVVEECLAGPRVIFVVSDGERALPIGSAQDRKRIFDDDRGPNTGGWARSLRALSTARCRRVMHEIVEPISGPMAAEVIRFVASYTSIDVDRRRSR